MRDTLQTAAVKAFDHWIRSSFKEINSELEAVYFQQDDPGDLDAQPDKAQSLRDALVDDGQKLIQSLLLEGNTDSGFDSGFDLLGNVGLYMAACRRHEITEPSRETKSPLKEASALAMQIGASLGVTPRFATSHLATHNYAVNGVYKSFTDLADEKLFIDFNTRGILAYKRAADALLKILPLGVSHPIAADLLRVCGQALQDVITSNEELFKRLDADRFYFNVRPYYKPHRVGSQIYRGANAGDFAGINVIDLLLGLCKGEDAYYSQLLVDKFLYMMPEDQAILRDCMRRQSLLNELMQVDQSEWQSDWYQTNTQLYLDVCEQHGKAAKQHHDFLVDRFIVQMADKEPAERLERITASGPPLDVLVRSLETLKDLRCAADRDGIPTRYSDLKSIRARVL